MQPVGERRKAAGATTKNLIVDIAQMIAIASSASTLYPGDLIATGTPAGVGPIRTATASPSKSTMSADERSGRRSKRGSSPVFSTPYEFKRAPV